MTRWTPELLRELERIGDPRLEGEASVLSSVETYQPPEETLPDHLQAWRKRDLGAVPGERTEDTYWLDDHDAWPEDVPQDGFEHAPLGSARIGEATAQAQELFALFGTEVAAALLLVSLPHAYAAEQGARVLAQTGNLESDNARRISETAQLLIDVMLPDDKTHYPTTTRSYPRADPARTLQPGGRGYITVRTTRLVHAVVREIIGSPDEGQRVAINQRDLLGTLGTFTVTVFDALDALGVGWNADAQAAWHRHWDLVAELLGIGTAPVKAALLGSDVDDHVRLHFRCGPIRPVDVADAREMVAAIMDTAWPPAGSAPPTIDANDAGRRLTRALLTELEHAMPAWAGRLPRFTMRRLVDPRVRDALGLGGGDMPESLFQRSTRAGHLRRRRPDPMAAATRMGLHAAATAIAQAAVLHFVAVHEDDPGRAPFRFNLPDPSGRLDLAAR